MIGRYVRGKVFVFIDAANLESTLGSLGWQIKYKKLYKYLTSGTQLVGVRYYCPRFDTVPQDSFFVVLKKAGFRLITKPLKVIKVKGIVVDRKADFDVEIAIDALLLLQKYKTMVLFSGDSDFAYLVNVLRRKGKRVVVVSGRYHIAKELIKACNKYLDLRKLRPYIEWT